MLCQALCLMYDFITGLYLLCTCTYVPSAGMPSNSSLCGYSFSFLKPKWYTPFLMMLGEGVDASGKFPQHSVHYFFSF